MTYPAFRVSVLLGLHNMIHTCRYVIARKSNFTLSYNGGTDKCRFPRRFKQICATMSRSVCGVHTSHCLM